MCHAKCRAALDQAVQENLIRTNPAVGCKLPPKRSREMQVLSHQELQRFLIQAKADGYFELFLLDLSTGLRRGELLALQWSDLDLDAGTLSVTKQVYEVKWKDAAERPQDKSLYPQAGAAACRGGGFQGVPKDGKVPVVVSLANQGG